MGIFGTFMYRPMLLQARLEFWPMIFGSYVGGTAGGWLSQKLCAVFPSDVGIAAFSHGACGPRVMRSSGMRSGSSSRVCLLTSATVASAPLVM